MVWTNEALSVFRSQAPATVYLAGPIAGLGYDAATDWRRLAVEALAHYGIRGLSPMRAKEFLAGIKELDADEYTHPLASPPGIVVRDRYDVAHCDMLFLNLSGAERVSIGSMVELGLAAARGIPIVLIMEEGDPVHDHAFVREIPGYWVDTVDEAIEIAAGFFGTV